MPDLHSLFNIEKKPLKLPFVQSHAFLIGIDNYEHVSPLKTAVKDVTDIAEILSDSGKHAYKVHLYTNSSKTDMEACFEKMQQEVKADDRVIYYFAGHGIAKDSEVDPKGYLVPADAKADDPDSLIKMDRLHEILTALPCKHGLLVLDCCFAGSFQWSTGMRSEIFDLGQTLYAERFLRYVKHPAWQVITSSAHDQKAADLLDQHALGLREGESDDVLNSPFAWAFKQAIDKDSKADVSGHRQSDGIVTVTELFLYLQEVVLTASQNAKRQSPAFFTLGSKHDTKGEFIFLNPGHKLNLEPAPSQNPYKGLVPFESSDLDSKTFFGRDNAIAKMRSMLKKTSILVVSAPSGQGKSSIVKAGLLPKLSADLEIAPIVLRPSEPKAEAWKQLADLELTQSAVVVVDQYEEMFSSKTEEVSWMSEYLLDLVDRILAFSEGAKKTLPNLKLIITIRSDFDWQLEVSKVGQGSEERRGFWEPSKICQFLYRLPPMTRDELREIMVKPSWVMAYDFESEALVEQILDEIHHAPGALPLLSFTLRKLFEERDTNQRLLTTTAYVDKLKGVNGALSTYADEVYHSLSPSEQGFMRKLILRMVQLNDGSYSRRKVYLKVATAKENVFINELDYPDHLDATKDAVLKKLEESLLLIVDPEGRYVEPMHDSLINFWPRCLQWIQDFGRENLMLQRQLWEAVLEWKSYSETEISKLGEIVDPKSKPRTLWDTHPKLTQVIQSVIEDVKPEFLRDDKSALWVELMAMTDELAPEDQKQVRQHLHQWRDKQAVPQLEAFIFSGASLTLFDILVNKGSHWINQEEVAFVKQSWEAKIADIIELKRERDQALEDKRLAELRQKKAQALNKFSQSKNLGNDARALFELDEYLKLAPEEKQNPYLLLSRAEILVNMRQIELAEKMYTILINKGIESGKTRYYLLRASFYVKEGKTEKAIDDCLSWIETGVLDQLVLIGIALNEVFYKTGNEVGSDMLIKRLLSMKEYLSSFDLIQFIVKDYIGRKKYQEAILLLERVEYSTTIAKSKLLKLKAELLFAQGKKEEALACIKLALPKEGELKKEEISLTAIDGSSKILHVWHYEEKLLISDGEHLISYDKASISRRLKVKKGIYNIGEATRTEYFIALNSRFVVANTNLSGSYVNIAGTIMDSVWKSDGFQNWDKNFLSISIGKWSLGTGDRKGELPALLKQIKDQNPELFGLYFGKYGLDISTQTNEIAGYLSLNGIQIDTADLKEQFRSNEWAFIFSKALQDKTVRAILLERYMGRINTFYRNDSYRPLKAYFISELISSEYGLALLLDHHINYPDHLMSTGKRDILGEALIHSGLTNPEVWTTEEKKQFVKAYLIQRNASNMRHSKQRADRISKYLELDLLSDQPGSFYSPEKLVKKAQSRAQSDD